MTRQEDIKKHIRELFIGQKLAVLSTHRSGQPYASLVAFVGKEDLKEIFCNPANDTKTCKFIGGFKSRAPYQQQHECGR